MQRRILPMAQEHMRLCLDFLLPREWSCVSFSEAFLDTAGKKSGTKRRAQVFLLAGQEQRQKPEEKEPAGFRLDGILLLSPEGTLLHCLPEEICRDKSWKRILRPFLRKQNVRAILGEEKANRFLETACAGIFRHLRFHHARYLLMRRQPGGKTGTAQDAASAVKNSGMTAVLCGEQDTERLLPVQEAYESEEVLRGKGRPDRAKTRMRLRRILRRQTVVACTGPESGEILGKAGTNAQGLHWQQIGGVFTRPDARNRGIACFLVTELVRRAENRNKGSVLFVRPDNPAAIRVYGKCGFTLCGGFRSVWRRF